MLPKKNKRASRYQTHIHTVIPNKYQICKEIKLRNCILIPPKIVLGVILQNHQRLGDKQPIKKKELGREITADQKSSKNVSQCSTIYI